MRRHHALIYLYNGNIITMNRAMPRSPHMLVANGRIWHCAPDPAPLGLDYRDADFSKSRKELAGQVSFVDLKGATVIPGLCDAHAHFLWWGVALAQVDLHSATSEVQCIDQIKAHVGQSLAAGEWITGGRWAHNLWDGAVLPSSKSLDEAFPDNPVLLSSKCGHLAWANSAALGAAGVTVDTADPDGGEIERKDGNLQASLKRQLLSWFQPRWGS